MCSISKVTSDLAIYKPVSLISVAIIESIDSISRGGPDMHIHIIYRYYKKANISEHINF